MKGVPPMMNPTITAMVEGAKSYFKSTVSKADDKNFRDLSNNRTLYLVGGMFVDINGSVHSSV